MNNEKINNHSGFFEIQAYLMIYYSIYSIKRFSVIWYAINDFNWESKRRLLHWNLYKSIFPFQSLKHRGSVQEFVAATPRIVILSPSMCFK